MASQSPASTSHRMLPITLMGITPADRSALVAEASEQLQVVRGQPRLVEQLTARAPDREDEGLRPRVLDESDRGRASGQHRVVEGPGGVVGSARSSADFLVLRLTEERGGESAEVRVCARRSRQRLEATVLGARDEQDVEQPHDAGLAEPGQLGQDLPGQRRLLEADHEHLYGAAHGATRPRSRRCSSGVITPVSRRCCRAASWSAREGAGSLDGTRARVRGGVRLCRCEPAAVVGHVAGHAGTSKLPGHQQHGSLPSSWDVTSMPQSRSGLPVRSA